MEDLKNTREEQSLEEVSHKDIEQTFKESTPPPPAQSSTLLNCVPTRPGSSPASGPCPAPGGPAAPPVGGNNAKRTTVANGQPSSGASARYVPREVPPRFRNQQEPKVLLRRGQPLVGGAIGEPSLSAHTGELFNANALDSSDPDVDPASLVASQSSATSTYANSTWGHGSGALPPSQGMDKVVVDSSNLEAWPSVAEGRRREEPCAQSTVASWDGSQGMQDSQSEGVGLCEVGGACTPDEYAVGSAAWGPSSQASVGGASAAVEQSFSSEGLEEEPPSSSSPEGWPAREAELAALPADLDRASSESALTASREASSSPGSAQDEGGWEDGVQEREAGPELSGADVTDVDRPESEETAQVSASSDSNPPALRIEGWGSGADAGQGPGMWGPSGESQGSWGGNDGGSCGASQGEAGRVREQAAEAVCTCDTPPGDSSEVVSERFAGSLQDPRKFVSKAAALDNQKGAGEREGVEGVSAGHTLSEGPSPEVALQSMLSCSNLDPRVLCNTGWGQTQIKQGVAWDLDTEGGAESAGGRNEHAQTDPNGRKSPQRPVPSEGSQVKGSRVQGWGGDGGGWGEQREERWHRSEVERGSESEQTAGSRGGGWAESAEEERGTRWGENRSEGGRWGQRGTEWAEERAGRHGGQDEGSWGSSEDEGRRGWAGKDVDTGLRQHKGWADALHPTPPPKNQTAPKGPSQPQTGAVEGRARPGGTAPPGPGGWTSGPIPRMSPAAEPSGWEEPSPQSISRRLEIDDGTAAWGDPSHYDSKSVNMWEKSARQRPPPVPPQPPRQAPAPAGRDKSTAWDRGGGLSEPPVDNGTAAWGKTFDNPSSWRAPEDSGKGSGWGNANQAKSGSKSVPDGWGDDGGSSRHASWEEEGGGMGMWGSSGGWPQGQGGKRSTVKGTPKGNDSWTAPVTRQFSSMGITDEEATSSSSDRPRRGASDFNGDSRKGGRVGGPFRSQNPKDAAPTEPGPYFDKMASHGMFGASGGLNQLRGMQQPGVHPVNPSPGIRAQVPHQFLPPQVSGSMLKPMAPPSGGVFPPQLSPQHMAVLSGIHPQMQQFQLACQLLLQQQQQQQQQFLSQRKFPPPPLRQQHDPQQLARIMTLLQQQRSQQGVGGPKLSPPHPGGGAPKQPEGPLLHSAMGGSVADLQPKAASAFSGFGSGVELESVMGGAVGGLKEAGGSQSRFKWMMEAGHPLAPSPPDPMLHKNGLVPGQMKLRADSPYSQYDLLGAENMGVASQSLTDTWHRTAAAKLGSAPSTPTWPPEFQPGVPWKGVQSPDPDPYMTPGGMLGSPILSDTDHQLLQDNTESNPSLNTLLPSPGAWPYSASDNPLSTHNSAKFSEFKSSWPPEPIGHNKSWRTNRNSSHLPRPPPGLTNQKQSSSSLWSGAGPRMPRGWGPGGRNQDTPFGAETSWSGGSTGSSWLLLRNLTPQIDGSTLRTICLQHGPLMTFHLGLTQGSALIRYCSPHEAAKAQTALHMCVLGNTTILAEFVSEDEVARYFTHSQSSGVAGSPEGSSVPDPTGREGERERSGGGGVGDGGGGGDPVLTSSTVAWQGLDISASLTGSPAVEGPGLTLLSQWSNSGADGQGGGVWGGVASGYHGSSLWGAPQMEDSPAGLFPGDLLGGGADTL